MTGLVTLTDQEISRGGKRACKATVDLPTWAKDHPRTWEEDHIRFVTWGFETNQQFKVAKDPSRNHINAFEQHIKNLPTLFFFNTLYDPYNEGTGFVCGYPFSLREGVSAAVSHNLWLNIPDYDAPT